MMQPNAPHRYPWLDVVLVLAAAALYLAWFAAPLLTAGTANPRLVAAVFLDEGISQGVIRTTLDAETLLLQRRDYGHAYFNAVLLPLTAVQQFAPVSDQQIIVTLRLVSLLFAVGTVGATYVLARHVLGRPLAFVAAGLLAVVPVTFLRYGLLARADVMQLFFLVIGLYATIRLAASGSRRWLWAAVVAAGLACATKYSGLFLLPLIWAVMLATIYAGQFTPRTFLSDTTFRRGLRVVLAGGAAGALLVALLFTPDLIAALFTTDGQLADGALPIVAAVRLGALVVGGLLLLAVALPQVWAWLRQQTRLVRVLHATIQQVALTGILFGAVYILAAPALLPRFDFIRTFLYQISSKTHGLTFASERSRFEWFEILAAPPLLTLPLVLLAGVSLAVLVVGVVRDGWRAFLTPPGLLWVWVAMHMAILVLAIRHFGPQYLLPAIPFMIMLALHPFTLLHGWLTAHLAPPQARLATGLAVALVLLITLPGAATQVLAYRSDTANPHDLQRVAIGDWLRGQYPTSSSIATDYYYPQFVPPAFEYVVTAYVPPSFASIRDVQPENFPDFATAPPDVALVALPLAQQFADAARADDYFLGRAAFLEHRNYYATLRDPTSGYQLVHRTATFEVYEYCPTGACRVPPLAAQHNTPQP